MQKFMKFDFFEQRWYRRVVFVLCVMWLISCLAAVPLMFTGKVLCVVLPILTGLTLLGVILISFTHYFMVYLIESAKDLWDGNWEG